MLSASKLFRCFTSRNDVMTDIFAENEATAEVRKAGNVWGGQFVKKSGGV